MTAGFGRRELAAFSLLTAVALGAALSASIAAPSSSNKRVVTAVRLTVDNAISRTTAESLLKIATTASISGHVGAAQFEYQSPGRTEELPRYVAIGAETFGPWVVVGRDEYFYEGSGPFGPPRYVRIRTSSAENPAFFLFQYVQQATSLVREKSDFYFRDGDSLRGRLYIKNGQVVRIWVEYRTCSPSSLRGISTLSATFESGLGLRPVLPPPKSSLVPRSEASGISIAPSHFVGVSRSLRNACPLNP